MDEYDAGFEDCATQEIFIEFLFEDWPLLPTLEEMSRQNLCSAICAALEAAACPVQAIKAKSDALQIVVMVSVDLSMDDVADIVDVTARKLTAGGANTQGPLSYSAESISPADVVDAVLRLR